MFIFMPLCFLWINVKIVKVALLEEEDSGSGYSKWFKIIKKKLSSKVLCRKWFLKW